jgi:hypothetical protein
MVKNISCNYYCNQSIIMMAGITLNHSIQDTVASTVLVLQEASATKPVLKLNLLITTKSYYYYIHLESGTELVPIGTNVATSQKTHFQGCSFF